MSLEAHSTSLDQFSVHCTAAAVFAGMETMVLHNTEKASSIQNSCSGALSNEGYNTELYPLTTCAQTTQNSQNA